VAQQQGDFGEPLDDVIVDAVSAADGSVMRLSLQVKRSLTISDAVTNTDFREVIQRSWQPLQKPMFREHVDRVGAATGTVTEESFRNFTTVCELARASDSTTVFMQRFTDGGNASQAHRAVLEAVRKVAADGAGAPFSDDDLHRLFRHLTLIRFDFLHAGSTHEAEAIVSLQRSLISAHVGRAGELWSQLRLLARDGAGRSAEHARASVLRSLTGGLRFNGAPALAADIQVLKEGTRLWLAQQADDIGGTHLDRQVLQDKLAAEMSAHRLTLIKGLPGTGKTVLLRGMVQRLAAGGTALLLTANRLSGRSLGGYPGRRSPWAASVWQGNRSIASRQSRPIPKVRGGEGGRRRRPAGKKAATNRRGRRSLEITLKRKPAQVHAATERPARRTAIAANVECITSGPTSCSA
jgi:hypothetical protein